MIHGRSPSKQQGNTVLWGSVTSYKLGKMYWKVHFAVENGDYDQTQFILFPCFCIKWFFKN